MATDQQFCLRWNNHQSTLISVFDTLLENGTLVDCTLAAEGQYLKAHKVVLSACSPYFEVLMSQHYEKHPILILKDVKFQELKAMIDYMYRGEVNISQDQLGTFLKAAESLQIKGLSDGGGGESDARDVGSTATSTPKRADPTRKVPPPSPAMPQPRAERRPAEVTSPIPPSDGSISPSLRKRRRIRRSSQGDDSNDLDSASNASDMQSTPVPSSAVPSIPAPMTPVVPSTSSTITKPEQTDSLSRLDNSNSLPPESGLIKAKMEPVSEGLLEPKAECPDYLNNENSIEDLTLDDDDEMEMSNMASTSQGSDQGFLPWQMSGNQSGSEQVFMGSQEGLAGQGQRGDSQGRLLQRKWRSLRDCYTRELNVQNQMKSGSARVDRKQYIFFNQLSFLRQSVEKRKTKSSLDEDQNNTNAANVNVDAVVDSELTPMQEDADANETQLSPRPTTPSQHKTISQPIEKLSVRPPIVTSRKRSQEQVAATELKVLQDISKRLCSSTEDQRGKKFEEDEDRLFLLSLLNDLKKVHEDNKLELKSEMILLIKKWQKAPNPTLNQFSFLSNCPQYSAGEITSQVNNNQYHIQTQTSPP